MYLENVCVFCFDLLHYLLTNFNLELNQLTGIAAILRFPLPEIDELEDSDSDFDDEEYVEEYKPNP